MNRRFPTARRRGMSLAELQVAILILALISAPCLSMGIGLVRDSTLNRVETDLQWDVDHALWRVTRPLREVKTLTNATTNSYRAVTAENGVREIYLQNGSVWEKIGTNGAVVIAADVADLKFTYRRTLAGNTTQLTGTIDPEKVTEVIVELTVSRGGISRTGYLLTSLRCVER